MESSTARSSFGRCTDRQPGRPERTVVLEGSNKRRPAMPLFLVGPAPRSWRPCSVRSDALVTSSFLNTLPKKLVPQKRQDLPEPGPGVRLPVWLLMSSDGPLLAPSRICVPQSSGGGSCHVFRDEACAVEPGF